jgi:diguanylate cyclase (GGDEF)-like protein
MAGILKSYMELLTGTNEPAFLINGSGSVIFWNQAAMEATGLDASQVEGTLWWETVFLCEASDTAHREPSHDCPVFTCPDNTKPRVTKCRVKTAEHGAKDVTIKVIPLAGLREEALHAAILFSPEVGSAHGDIFGEASGALALLDPVTRVGTRRYLELALQGKFDEFRRYGANLAIVGVRLNNYERISLALGKERANQELAFISERIAKSVRASDVVGRWTRDIIMVIVLNASAENLANIAERFKRAGERIDDEPQDFKASVTAAVTRANTDDTMVSLLDRCLSLLDQGPDQTS